MNSSEVTGIKGLDGILQGIRLGDNVVWQVDNIESYRDFVSPYVNTALSQGKKVIYIRFAEHPPVMDDKRAARHDLDASIGFESFSKQIHDIITKEGEGAYYVFDCLTDLILSWATDLMIGNFFMVTCPYLFKLDAIAYFAILRNNHSYKTIARIRETTQLLIDVYDLNGKYYVHPLKVWNRYSPTMFLPHAEGKNGYTPLINSADATELYSYMSEKGLEAPQRMLDYWDRLFMEAEGVVKDGGDKKGMLDRLCSVMLGSEPRMMELLKKQMTLEDLLSVKSRMIGTGFIGGKALGMLLARKILVNDSSFEWEKMLEPHDSFYIGSDIFYSYIVENGWWEQWLAQKGDKEYSEKTLDLKNKMLNGSFPEAIKEQFLQMLEYYGQSPIIVRSSSLLEDGFGNAFAGKYESIFCVNQGSPRERYQKFESIVKQVFASTLNEDAITYRMQRGLIQQDEQMALLVQRVSGSYRGDHFFPYIAGVGVSFNTFVWHKDMDPKAGMLRLVFGLGTRAVNRVEGDYPRTAALDAPMLLPYTGEEGKCRFTQKEVDLLNIKENELQSIDLNELISGGMDIPLDLVAEKENGIFFLTFKKLLSKTGFVKEMRSMLSAIEKAYRYPVDVEFTVNYTSEGEARINLLQCRPLQAKGAAGKVAMPKKTAKKKTLFSSSGNFMGGNVSRQVDLAVVIDPETYSNLLYQKKFSVARTIGKINRRLKEMPGVKAMLIGRGRWGTRDATLGVPVSFAEINNFSALVEVSDPASGMMPELSFGSHFFLDLVEADIFYAALFLEKEGTFLNREMIDRRANMLKDLVPDDEAFIDVIKVCRLEKMALMSEITSQKVVCFAA